MNYISILNSVQGPIPVQNVFVVPSDSAKQVLLVSGAAWTQIENKMLVVEVLIGNAVVGTLQVFSNQAGTGRAFPTLFIPLALAPGTYSLSLQVPPNSQTGTDGSCFFNAMLLL